MTREEAIEFIAQSVKSDVDMALVADAIKALEQEPRWIPVSERLPEEKRAVLVWCPQYKNIYCAYLEKEQWWIFGAFVQIVLNEVMAWKPLPEPYREEGETE